MAELTHRASSLLVPSSKTPDTSLSIKVNRKSLRCVIDKGLSKGSWFERHNPLRLSNRVAVEAAEFGTADSVFFVPEQPNVNLTSRRVAPVEYVKVSPYTTADAVSQDDAFEISFVGMSISPQDAAGDNELLLFSLTKEDFLPAESKLNASAHPAPDVSDLSATTASAEQEEDPDKDFIRKVTSVASVAEQNPAIDNKDLGDLPTSITIHPGDHPFIHFDPEVDGHDTGNQPDTFVPIPGSKRVYMQRQPECNNKYGDINMRFTVMEIDKLSEEQLIAIRNLDSIGKSVGKAASAVPYLKVISAILKFANFLGRSALKKVSQPDHVMSKDMAFMLAPGPDRENGNEKMKREEFGNYLRVSFIELFHACVRMMFVAILLTFCCFFCS